MVNAVSAAMRSSLNGAARETLSAPEEVHFIQTILCNYHVLFLILNFKDVHRAGELGFATSFCIVVLYTIHKSNIVDLEAYNICVKLSQNWL